MHVGGPMPPTPTLLAQWTEHGFPKAVVQVRFLGGVRLLSFLLASLGRRVQSRPVRTSHPLLVGQTLIAQRKSCVFLPRWL